ncbi:MAG: hypothetical protein A3F40_01835 [Chlamydiae bacterium RIFCSPHIGHO2_12_FULL_27_8]|nr:MAG: hypothetical protein A3F40_01835 [Chlamydiae bacterium RIFCSPHIGHO2_12_FULL_27_8]
MMKSKFLYIIILLFSSCYRVEDKLEPNISYNLDEKFFQSLQNPSTPLTDEEKKEDFAKEFIIAKRFAKEMDLYRAITNFKRAEILADSQNCRFLEIQYNILLCYFLAKKYEDVILTFEKSSLENVDKSFYAFEDLLIILYESYRELKNEEKTAKILEILQENFPDMEKNIVLSTALLEGDLYKIKNIADEKKDQTLNVMLKDYQKTKKSIKTAQLLNIIPGAGYLYIGQKKSAFTAFTLNSLFIYAAYECFARGWKAAGIITLSFEAGWYFGGIYGAGEEAKFYNERIYENYNSQKMQKDKQFPVFMLKYGF